jgi:hypothetical protein
MPTKKFVQTFALLTIPTAPTKTTQLQRLIAAFNNGLLN